MTEFLSESAAGILAICVAWHDYLYVTLLLIVFSGVGVSIIFALQIYTHLSISSHCKSRKVTQLQHTRLGRLHIIKGKICERFVPTMQFVLAPRQPQTFCELPFPYEGHYNQINGKFVTFNAFILHDAVHWTFLSFIFLNKN